MSDLDVLKPWLYRILRNEHARRFERKAPALEDCDVLELSIMDPVDLERDYAVREQLALLAPQYREPLLLQVLGGFSCAEIAGVLGIRAWPVLAALAAALVLALGWPLWLPEETSTETLAAGIIDHVRHEPEALAAEQGVSRATLAHTFARSGGELGGVPLTASYAGRCPLPGGGQGEHIVLKTPLGKVTLILMPGKPVTAALRLFKDGLNVSVLPAGQGSLALVAESDALVHGAEAYLLRAVRWRGSGI